uniref:Putative sulfotransferase n=1 Tax=Magnetococcus massalia (strain MO-1) TaxID=451514 RepID=A0A1S7LH53_MAGMO|nr:putative sulfotransferase [Candidatus Magnetococcus massalia]
MNESTMRYKTVWIASPPRTGSMWIFNVTRELLRAAGRTVLPTEVPKRDQEMADLAQHQAWQDSDPNRIWVLKVHAQLEEKLPHSRIITTMRDPRDLLISFRRFMGCDFETALKQALLAVEQHDAYAKYGEDVLLKLHYRDVTETPDDTLRHICSFLGISVAGGELATIVDRFSRERVAQHTEAITQNLKSRLQKGEEVLEQEVVMVAENKLRAYDRNTGFQSGHVSSEAAASWRMLLSDEEKLQVHQKLGEWLVNNGYGLE